VPPVPLSFDTREEGNKFVAANFVRSEPRYRRTAIHSEPPLAAMLRWRRRSGPADQAADGDVDSALGLRLGRLGSLLRAHMQRLRPAAVRALSALDAGGRAGLVYAAAASFHFSRHKTAYLPICLSAARREHGVSCSPGELAALEAWIGREENRLESWTPLQSLNS
jgi:hypothetical protein